MHIRKRIYRELQPLTKFLKKHGITPNIITSTSLILLPPTCYFLINHQKAPFLTLFILISFLDALDGATAENENLKTQFGQFYDAFADRIVEGAIYFSLAISYENLIYLSFVALILSYLTSYIASWERSLKYTGIGSRAGRLLIFIIAFAIEQIYYGLIIISIVSLITIFHRLLKIGKKYKLKKDLF